MYCIIVTTTDSIETAESLAVMLVKEKLSSCVQINNVTSVYQWESKIEKIQEYKISIKSVKSKYPLVEKLILEKHTYKVPQVIMIDISEGYPEYLNWLNL